MFVDVCSLSAFSRRVPGGDMAMSRAMGDLEAQKSDPQTFVEDVALSLDMMPRLPRRNISVRILTW